MLLAFDVVEEAIAEHDDWHTHEHLPERLGIPGFLRGTRWVALRGKPRYFVLYEVAEVATLASAPYLERLNNPSKWTTKMMPHYRGMTRGFCSVTGSFGFGTGNVSHLVRFKPDAGNESSLRSWLIKDALPGLPSRPGIGSVHLLEGARTPAMTNEQRIRGADAGVDWALIVTAYRQEALDDLMQGPLGKVALEKQGATGLIGASYRLDYSLGRNELDAG
jgi:hypothetical protein